MADASPIAFVLCIIVTCGVIFTTVHNEWKKNSQLDSDAVLDNIYKCEGLWVRCTTPVVGQFQCDQFETALLGLPAQLQAMRAFMVLSSIFAAFSIAAAGVGLRCNASMVSSQKLMARRVAAGLIVLAGLLTLAATSWYAAGVVQEFWTDQIVDSSFQYEFGAALYIGWASACLALISGAMLACCVEQEDDEDGGTYKYTYNPPKAQSATRTAEYV